MLTEARIKREIDRWYIGLSRLAKLKNYYDGKHDILKKTVEGNKPNNKLVHNFPSYIVDMYQGYFIGAPVVYTGEPELLSKVQEILNQNDEQDENSELARQMGIYGMGFEIVYIDEDLNVRFNRVSPLNLKIVYNTDITPKIIGAIRRYTIVSDDGFHLTYYFDVYDEKEIITYELLGQVEISRKQHFFNEVPVIEYLNNSDRTGDFESVITLIDAYNLSRSNKTNDLDYFSDAYLQLTGMLGTTTEDVATMRENRVMLLAQNGGASFLTKPSNVDDAKEQIKKLGDDIHKFSKTLDVSDEKFVGYASSVAMGYKLLAIEQVAANKERKFKRGLQRRLSLICNYLNFKGSSYNYLDLSIKFERNLPVDESSKITGALQLNGFVSKETALSYLPSSIVGDPAMELARLDNEKTSYPDSTFLESPQVTVPDVNLTTSGPDIAQPMMINQ